MLPFIEVIKLQMYAPWSDQEIEALRKHQEDDQRHPYTCGNRGDGKHPFEEKYLDTGALRPTREGWVCPYCDYTQDWA